MRENQVKIETETLVSNSTSTLNAKIRVQVRNIIHTKKGLIQHSATYTELTPEGARQLIANLQFALSMPEDAEYLIHPDSSVHEGSTYYDSVSDYLSGKPSADN